MSSSEVAVEKMPLQSLASLNREEVDLAISTAKQFPRDMVRAVHQTTALVTSTPEFAGLCVYAIPRGGKIIEGPSVRFAECLAHSWGNLTVGARVAEEQAAHIVAQGVAHDLETNTRYTFEVKRRITDKDGNRYNADMIGTTGNAACAIALRNAILRVVPRALWGPIYDQTRECIGGKQKPKGTAEVLDVTDKRNKALAFLQERWQITGEQVCKILKLDSVDKIGADQIVTLRGLATALQDGDITVDQALRGSKPIPTMPKPLRGKKKKKTSAPKSKASFNIMETEYVDPKKSECKECKASFGVHLIKCSKFKPPNTPVAHITDNQFLDLQSFLSQERMEMTTAAAIARKLGHAGKVKDLPAALLPKLYEELGKGRG